VSEQPFKPSQYRRMWLRILAVAVVAVGVAGAVLGWQLGQPPASPTPAATVSSALSARDQTAATPPPTVSPSLTTAKPERGVLWQQTGSEPVARGWFSAPGRWRIVWSFDCQNFAAYGGGNFKLSGGGAFEQVSVQRFAVRAKGTELVTGGGRGNLVIESVCTRWTVKAIAA
jgi:hypothetical protein